MRARTVADDPGDLISRSAPSLTASAGLDRTRRRPAYRGGYAPRPLRSVKSRPESIQGIEGLPDRGQRRGEPLEAHALVQELLHPELPGPLGENRQRKIREHDDRRSSLAQAPAARQTLSLRGSCRSRIMASTSLARAMATAASSVSAVPTTWTPGICSRTSRTRSASNLESSTRRTRSIMPPGPHARPFNKYAQWPRHGAARAGASPVARRLGGRKS